MTPPSILVVGFHSVLNAGDAALLEACLAQLRSAFVDPEVTVLANYPQESDLRKLGVHVAASPQALLRTRAGPQAWGGFIEAVRHANLVVECPGNHFFSMGRIGLPFLLAALPLCVTHAARKPFYVMHQSIGPLSRKWEGALLRSLYRRARLVILRDSASSRLAVKLGLPQHILRVLPDAAFAPPHESASPALSDGAVWLERIPKPRLAVTVIPRMVRTLELGMMRRYLSALSDAIAEFSDQTGANIVFLPQSCGPTPVEDDREVIRALVNGLSGHPRLHPATQIMPRPSTLRGLYRVMDAVLASRLHSAVFALGEQVPTLVIGYLTKSRGVMEAIGLDEWVLDIDRLDEGHLLSRMLDLWQDRSRLRSILGERIPDIRQRAALGGALIRSDYDNGN